MSAIGTSAAATRHHRHRARALDDEQRLGRMLLAPAVIYIVALVGFPFFLAIFYSVSDATVGSTSLDFVGLLNYERILHDPTFWTSLQNALVFTIVSQALVVVLGTILAMALFKDFPGKWIVRLLILLPWVAPISLGSIG
ncbi:MAG: sugar ABC transporter permease, partial [Proteobacteria bacterium]|nr:sugar ABC transporter permease [Pseudomonadota bacterium]